MPYVEKHYRVLTDRAHTRDRGAVDGRHPDAPRRHPAPRQVRLRRRVQLRADRRVPRARAAGRAAHRLPRRLRHRVPAAPAASAPRGAGHRRAPPLAADWAQQNAATLDNAEFRKGLKLLWFSTGKDDGLITTSNATVDLLKKHGLNATFKESPGGHTWINWRNYLNEFVPQLFQ